MKVLPPVNTGLGLLLLLLTLVAFVSEARLVGSWQQTNHIRPNSGLLSVRRSVDEKRELAIAFVEQQLKQNLIPGVALSIVYKNETVLARGFGTKEAGNPANKVTASTLFQIGSYTKTFIAVGIAKLVDEGRVHWDDPVKQHLPWFALIDKYAEKFTTLGDLLSMNSVLGAYEGDVAFDWKVYTLERDLVGNLSYINTTRPLRADWAYSNMNFAILGQVIEAKTGKQWAEYLRETIWEPLGMHNTFGRALDATDKSEVSFGHFVCSGRVAGPFSLLNDLAIAAPAPEVYFAAGSIVSSAGDLSLFSRFLLINGAGIFKSPNSIATLTTGHTINMYFTSALEIFGFSPTDMRGRSLAAGYGFDIVGNVMFGYDYFNKGGDTHGYKTRNGFVPSEQLGIVLQANAEPSEDVLSMDTFAVDRMVTYLLGLFLDVPDAEIKAALDKSAAVIETIPKETCQSHLYDGVTRQVPGIHVPFESLQQLIGTYLSTDSKFYGHATVFLDGSHAYFRYGGISARLLPTSSNATTFVLDTDFGDKDIDVEINDNSLNFLGLNFTRQ